MKSSGLITDGEWVQVQVSDAPLAANGALVKMMLPVLPTIRIGTSSLNSDTDHSSCSPPDHSPPDHSPSETEDELFYIRCRKAILRLSANLLHAAEHRSDFAPFLLEAMHNAMTNLLEHGDERDLLLLEQWLDEDSSEDIP